MEGGTPTCKRRVPRSEKALEEWTSSEEESGGEPKPKLGDGLVGRGKPVHTFWSGNYYPFHDGAGLCSPGRWDPAHRTGPLNLAFGLIDQARGLLERAVKDVGCTDSMDFVLRLAVAADGLVSYGRHGAHSSSDEESEHPQPPCRLSSRSFIHVALEALGKSTMGNPW